MDARAVDRTVPGVVAAAADLHRAKSTRPELEARADEATAHLEATPFCRDDPAEHFAARNASVDAERACRRNTEALILSAAQLVDAARLELLDAVYDAAAVDGWSLRELAEATGVSRGTIANVLKAGGVTTAHTKSHERHEADPAPPPIEEPPPPPPPPVSSTPRWAPAETESTER